MPTIDMMNRIAATDATFTRQGTSWVGKCLICNGPVGFDASTGAGANIEHILPRSLGGSGELLNLGITHARCNAEKGRRWDPKRRHRGGTDRSERYQALVERLLAERRARWRDPAVAGDVGDDAGIRSAEGDDGGDDGGGHRSAGGDQRSNQRGPATRRRARR